MKRLCVALMLGAAVAAGGCDRRASEVDSWRALALDDTAAQTVAAEQAPPVEPRPEGYALIPIGPSVGSTLVTKNYIVTIYHNCPEGCVSCDSIIYCGVSKKTGRTLVLRGSKVVTNGGLGHFVGYRFENGSITYSIHDNSLGIYRNNNETLAEEEGTWLDSH